MEEKDDLPLIDQMTGGSSLQHNKKAMLQALEKNLGVVTTSAKAAGIDRATHYRWMQKDPAYKQLVEELSNVALDFAESQLHQQIKSGNASSTIFYLKTKGKKRGYTERMEVVDRSKVDENLEDMSNDELMELMQSLTDKLNG